jgi:hypothetical protein
MFHIRVETKLHPTESFEKVALALQTVVPGEVSKRSLGEQVYLYITSDDYTALENLHTLIRQQRILDVARNELKRGVVDHSTIFFLNKQVAFVNKLNFCEPDGESPLGPLRVEINYEPINVLIDWLAPYTKDGKEVVLVSTLP